MRILLVSANRERLPSPVMPLGLLSVAAALRDAHEVALVDLCFEEDAEAAVARAAAAFAPDLIGVGLRNLHGNDYRRDGRALDGWAAAVAAARRASGAPVVLGGAAFSLQPELLLARLGADGGVAGEGERAFRGLADAVARGGHVPRLLRGEPGPLDGLPAPARDLADPRYLGWDGTANLQTKRGCAFACAYCDYPELEGRAVRVRDPDAVADEVAALAERPGTSHLFIVDSVFNAPRAHALAVCRALAARGGPLPWVCYASPVSVDGELAEAMAAARCVGVEVGSDAGNDETLARLRKPFRLDAVARAHRAFAAAGVRECHTFVLGAFDETVDEVRRTLDYVAALDPDVAVFLVFAEDRGDGGRARHREAILALLSTEAPRQPGWVVPELGIRFGAPLERALRRAGHRGPSWLALATARPRRAGAG